MNRTQIAAALLALALVGPACGADDGNVTSSGTSVAGTDDTTAAVASAMTVDECVDVLIVELNATDFEAADAMADLETRLTPVQVACSAYPGDAVQSALEVRRDELSEGAQAVVFAETDGTVEGDAAGLPCVAPVDDLGVDIGGADLPVGAPPTELVMTDITVGDGVEVADGATVKVDYVGYSCSTGTVFDSSYSRGEPIEFGLGDVIPGWSQGLVGMHEGGKRLLVIPSELGYGTTGSPPSIAPNEALVFVVEVHEVTS